MGKPVDNPISTIKRRKESAKERLVVLLIRHVGGVRNEVRNLKHTR